MQKAKNQNHFHSEFAAAVANSRRQRQTGGIGQVTDIVSQVDGLAIDDSPRRLEAMVNALAVIYAENAARMLKKQTPKPVLLIVANREKQLSLDKCPNQRISPPFRQRCEAFFIARMRKRGIVPRKQGSLAYASSYETPKNTENKCFTALPFRERR